MVIKGFCICGRQVSGGTDEILPRHHRHVAGSVARRKADRPPGHYPPDRPLRYAAAPAEAKIIR